MIIKENMQYAEFGMVHIYPVIKWNDFVTKIRPYVLGSSTTQSPDFGENFVRFGEVARENTGEIARSPYNFSKSGEDCRLSLGFVEKPKNREIGKKRIS